MDLVPRNDRMYESRATHSMAHHQVCTCQCSERTTSQSLRSQATIMIHQGTGAQSYAKTRSTDYSPPGAVARGLWGIQKPHGLRSLNGDGVPATERVQIQFRITIASPSLCELARIRYPSTSIWQSRDPVRVMQRYFK